MADASAAPAAAPQGERGGRGGLRGAHLGGLTHSDGRRRIEQVQLLAAPPRRQPLLPHQVAGRKHRTGDRSSKDERTAATAAGGGARGRVLIGG